MAKENKMLDVLKLISTLLVLGSHCLPLSRNDFINFYYGQWFFRFCVPLFLISAGYFFGSFREERKTAYIKRIGALYLISSLLYFPMYADLGVVGIIYKLAFGYYHLWYLSALLMALIIWFILEKIPLINWCFRKFYLLGAAGLLLIGAFYDEYQYVFQNLSNVSLIKQFGIQLEYLGGPRHALFFSLPMLLIGRFLYEKRDRIRLSKSVCMVLIGVSFALALGECMLLRHLVGPEITCDITLFNFYPAIFLIMLSFVWQPGILDKVRTKTLRKSADIVYISHIWVVVLVGRLFKVSYFPQLILVVVISFAFSWLYGKGTEFLQKKYDKTAV